MSPLNHPLLTRLSLVLRSFLASTNRVVSGLRMWPMMMLSTLLLPPIGSPKLVAYGVFPPVPESCPFLGTVKVHFFPLNVLIL